MRPETLVLEGQAESWLARGELPHVSGWIASYSADGLLTARSGLCAVWRLSVDCFSVRVRDGCSFWTDCCGCSFADRSAETGLVELVITQIGSLEVHWLFTGRGVKLFHSDRVPCERK